MDKNKLRAETFSAITNYLKACDWKDYTGPIEEEMFYYIDPLTGQKHRADFAWLIQTERDIMEMINKNKNV